MTREQKLAAELRAILDIVDDNGDEREHLDSDEATERDLVAFDEIVARMGRVRILLESKS